MNNKRNIAFNEDTKLASVGSCCTLIAEEILHQNNSELKSEILKELSILFIGTILLDTVNMSITIGKVTERDVEVMNNLHTEENLLMLFNNLNNAKSEKLFWRNLTAENAIEYDFKDFLSNNYKYGISSVFLSLKELLEKLNFINLIINYLNNNRDIFIIMSLILPDNDNQNMFRELSIFSKSQEKLIILENYLLNYNLQELQLEKIQFSIENINGNIIYYNYYKQGNVKISRKQMSVIFNEFYNSI